MATTTSTSRRADPGRIRPANVAIVLLAVVSVIATGVMYRRWNAADNGPVTLATASERMNSLPVEFAGWDGKEVQEHAFNELPREVFGTMHSRRYMHREKGTSLGFFAAFGRVGPICVHDPMLCVAEGRNVTVASGPTRVAIGDAGAEFYVATFTRNANTVPEHFRIFWSYSADGRWSAPESPRLAFASKRWLYKIYVTRYLQRPDEPLDSDPARDFIHAALPRFNPVLFPPQ